MTRLRGREAETLLRYSKRRSAPAPKSSKPGRQWRQAALERAVIDAGGIPVAQASSDGGAVKAALLRLFGVPKRLSREDGI